MLKAGDKMLPLLYTTLSLEWCLLSMYTPQISTAVAALWLEALAHISLCSSKLFVTLCSRCFACLAGCVCEMPFVL